MGILHQVRVKTAMKLLSTFLTLAIFSKGSTATPPTEREGRLGLFSIVTFPNSECQSTKHKENKGICYSSTECSGKGGLAEGNCAAGFGVCCIIKINSKTGGTISHNATIIENYGYPTVYATPTAATTIKYTLKPMKDICFMRFDFINFDFGLSTTAATYGACSDKFAVDIPTAVGSDPPAICGKNNGYHMYVDNMKSTADISLDVTVSTTAWTTRVWKIKVSQIGCDCPTKPPMGCHQYYLESKGTIESLNYQAASTNKVLPLYASNTHDWNICIRKNKGMCGTTYAQATSALSTEDTFQVNTKKSTTNPTIAVHDHSCEAVRLVFDGVSDFAPATHCGGVLNEVIGLATPGEVPTTGFKIRHQQIDTAATGGASVPGGYKLSYYQTGC